MYKIGLDIGGTTIKCGLFTNDNQLVKKISYKTPSGKNETEFIKTIEQIIISSLNQNNVSLNNVMHIGIGIPGISDRDGNIRRAVNLEIDYMPLKSLLTTVFPETKIFVENDALVAGVAERYKGVLEDCNNAALLTLGTGIGGAFVFDKKIYTSSFKVNSEVGHMIIGENFYDCACGNNGCFETFCSATGIIKYTNHVRGERESILNDILNDDPSQELNAKLIFDCYEKKDQLCEEIVERYIKYLSIGLANIVNSFSLDKIAIGGGISYSFNLFEEKLKKEMNKKLLLKDFVTTEIVVAEHKNDAGIIGASLLDLL